MQLYIDQLIEDIQNAKDNPRPTKMELAPELEFVRGAEEFLHGEQYEMGTLFGLEKKQFPPIDKLNAEQIKNIVSVFVDLWSAFNFIPEFPEGLPDPIKYNLLVDHLEEKTSYSSDGHNHFEFCDYDPTNCPFPKEFCNCTEFEEDYNNLIA